MGEIRTKVRLENNNDKALFKARKITKRKVRALEVEALVDTGAVMMLLPQDLVEDLGLEITGRQIVILADERRIEIPTAGDVFLTVAGRQWTTDCLVGPPGCTPLIGQLIMERLDLVADPGKRTLTVRPESPFYPTIAMRAVEPALV